MLLSATTVDLARAQFATTSIYHFLFVPLTLGLGPIVAVFQTLWLRTRDEAWLKLTHFFGTLFLINFAIGVATGLVQEFQFGMNWSVYSKFVGNVFGAPLAIEGLAAFFLESTFLGLWIFGWDRLSPRLHLATLWIAVAGTWLSAYFILVANSFMQDPVGYKIVNGQAQLTSVWSLLSSRWAYYAFLHTMLAGLTCGAALVFGVCCWHFARGRNVEFFRPAAKVALIFLVPVACFNMWFGSHFGILVTELQPMKISAAEAQWDDCEKCAFSLFQVGGFTQSDQTPSFSIEVPGLLSYLSTGSFNGKVTGLTELNNQYEAQYGRVTICRRSRRSTGACAGWPTPARSSPWSRCSAPSSSGSGGSNASMVSLARCGHDRPAVRCVHFRLVSDRDRPPAVDRPGTAEDRRRQLPGGQHHLACDQPRRLRQSLRRAAGAGRVADAPLRRP